jgi:hypothetical protein
LCSITCRDIIDTGLTMSSIVNLLRGAGAMSVRVAVLLDKRSRRTVTFDADYVGIVCPDQFVVGELRVDATRVNLLLTQARKPSKANGSMPRTLVKVLQGPCVIVGTPTTV